MINDLSEPVRRGRCVWDKRLNPALNTQSAAATNCWGAGPAAPTFSVHTELRMSSQTEGEAVSENCSVFCFSDSFSGRRLNLEDFVVQLKGQSRE